MNGSRVKWLKKEYIIKKNPKLIHLLKKYTDEERMKKMGYRQLFRRIKELWNQKLITKENLV